MNAEDETNPSEDNVAENISCNTTNKRPLDVPSATPKPKVKKKCMENDVVQDSSSIQFTNEQISAPVASHEGADTEPVESTTSSSPINTSLEIPEESVECKDSLNVDSDEGQCILGEQPNESEHSTEDVPNESEHSTEDVPNESEHSTEDLLPRSKRKADEVSPPSPLEPQLPTESFGFQNKKFKFDNEAEVPKEPVELSDDSADTLNTNSEPLEKDLSAPALDLPENDSPGESNVETSDSIKHADPLLEPPGRMDLEPSGPMNLEPSGPMNLEPPGPMNLEPPGPMDLECKEDFNCEDSAQPKVKPNKDSEDEASEEDERLDPMHKRPGTTGLSAKPKVKNLRRNIRDILDDVKLDETTVAAQKEEQLRLLRLQEKRAAMREYLEQQEVERFVATVAEAAEAQDTSSIKAEIAEEKPLEEIIKPEPLDDDDEDIVILSSEDEMPEVKHESFERNLCLSTVHDSDDSESETDDEELIKKEESDSDSDVVVLSNSEDEADDDDTNSGAHINDDCNAPDVNGRVLVNVGHPENEEDIFLAPQLAAAVKPHQIGGIRFLYDNIVESLEQFKTTNGFGCILAHSMGLGKTMQVISLTDVFLRYTGSKSVLIIVPINTLQNWLSEYNNWLPDEVPPHLTSDIRPRLFKVFVLNDGQKTMRARARVVKEWHEQGGVLLMGYELYRQLSLRKPKKPKKNKKKHHDHFVDVEEEDVNKEFLDEMNKALVRPGPDLVICDEGHRIKNAHANISQALKSIRTKRRVVLTGYPLQNSLIEYWCMVDFVRPNYLGTKTEFCNMFERPIQNGQCVDSTPQDMKIMRYRAHVLHSLLEGFVQRRGHSVLANTLPPKHEHVLLCRLKPIQRELYTAYMAALNTHKGMANPLKAFAICCKIWNHPDILYNLVMKRVNVDFDLDLDDMVGKAGRPRKRPGVKLDKPVNGNPKPSFPVWGPNAIPPPTDAPSFPVSLPSNMEQHNPAGHMPNPNMMPEHPMNGTQPMMSMNYGGYPGMYNMPPNYGQPYQWNYNQGFPRNQTNDSYPPGYANSYAHYGHQPLPGDTTQQPPTDTMAQYPPPPMNLPPENAMPHQQMFNSTAAAPEQNYPKAVETDQKCNDFPVGVGGDTKNDAFASSSGPSSEKTFDSMATATTPPSDDTHKSETEDSSKLLNGTDKKDDIKKEELPLEWAGSVFKDYVPGLIENSSKFEIFFRILDGCVKMGDRILVFSQSLFTLTLLEEFLQRTTLAGTHEHWMRNRTYFRLDGSTTAQEREKLINEFNVNINVRLFLVSTRAGSLGINLVGANRVIVFDASFNPCHDTQAVCRVYRYGQTKNCHIYRLVTDNSLEKRIYDRQVNKQGIADRIVDEMNPDAHLSSKEISNLLIEKEEEEPHPDVDFKVEIDGIKDDIFRELVTTMKQLLTRPPFQHESLLVDRKDKKLSTAEKRLAKRSYELEKQAANNQFAKGSYSAFYQKTTSSPSGFAYTKTMGGIRPMDAEQMKKDGVRVMMGRPNILAKSSTPVESLAKQGVSVQQITVPKDVSIPTNSGDSKPIQLKAGQSVMVIKTQKGMYLRLSDGKIVAIRVPSGHEETFGLPLNQGSVTIVPTTGAQNKTRILARGGVQARRGRPPLSAQYALGQIVPKGTNKGQVAVRIMRKPVISGRGVKSYQSIAVPASQAGFLKKNMTPHLLKELKDNSKVSKEGPYDVETLSPGASTSGVTRVPNRHNKIPFDQPIKADDLISQIVTNVAPKPDFHEATILDASPPDKSNSLSLPKDFTAKPVEQPITIAESIETPDRRSLMPQVAAPNAPTPDIASSLSKMHLPGDTFHPPATQQPKMSPHTKGNMQSQTKNPMEQSIFNHFPGSSRDASTQPAFQEEASNHFPPMGLPPAYSANNPTLFQPFLQPQRPTNDDLTHERKPWQLNNKPNDTSNLHAGLTQPNTNVENNFGARQFLSQNVTSHNPPAATASVTPKNMSAVGGDNLSNQIPNVNIAPYSQTPVDDTRLAHNFPNYSSAFRRMEFPSNVPADLQAPPINQITTTSHNPSLPPLGYSSSQAHSPYSIYASSYNSPHLGSFRGQGMNPGYVPYPSQFPPFAPQYPNSNPMAAPPGLQYPPDLQQQNPYELYQPPPATNPYGPGTGFGQGSSYPPM